MSSVVTFDCVDAYYSGVARGRSDEQERIIELLENIAKEFDRKEELERAIAKLKKELENERA
jgi:hypothetical protein